ncbi:MAG TPA: hypothetical protein VF116_09990 [Ktedonobacterales bacterium]
MRERRRSSRWMAIAAVLVLAAAVIAVGAVIFVARAKSAAMSSLRVSAVRIVRTSDFPQNGILPFNTTVRDAAQARRLYAALIALPEMPSGTYNCGEDLGVAYHFTFYQGATAVATAMVKPDGCQGATLPDGSYRWAATDQTFWQIFEELTGIPASNLIGLPACSVPTTACSPAPTGTAPPVTSGRPADQRAGHAHGMIPMERVA